MVWSELVNENVMQWYVYMNNSWAMVWSECEHAGDMMMFVLKLWLTNFVVWDWYIMVLMCLAILWSSGVVFVTVTAAWYIAGSLPLDSLTSSGLYMKDFGNLLFLYWLLLFSVLWSWSIYGNYFSGCLFHWKLQNSINSLLCTYFNKCTAYVSDFLLTSSFSFPCFRAFIKWTTS